MAKLTLSDILGQYASVTELNNNNTLIEDAIENTISRDGTSPNTMLQPLDMNSQRITNLPAPVANTDPLRLIDIPTSSTSNTAVLTSITDTAGYYTAANVEAALAEIGDDKTILDLSIVSEMVASTKLSVGDIVRTSGYNTKGDLGSNVYEIVAAGTDPTPDSGSFIDLAVHQAKGLFLSGLIRPEQFDAKVDGTTDDEPAINAASTYSNSSNLPLAFSGDSYITDKIAFYSGQRIIGTDRTVSGVSVDSSFNMAATAIVDFGSVEPGPTMTDFGVFCDQDDTESVRANVNQYPPAILATACPRFFIERLRISGAWDGIDMTGNSGGIHIDHAEIGALNIGIDINNPLDFIFLDNIEFWIFGMGAGNLYQNVYSDGTTIGINGVSIDGISFGTIGSFRTSIVIDGGFGNISQFNGDGRYSNLEVKGGAKLGVGTMYSSSDAADDFALKVSGANTHCQVATAWINNAADLTGSNGLIQLLTDATAILTISTLYAKTSGVNTRLVYQTEGRLTIDGGYWVTPQNVTMLEDFIDVDGGLVSISDIRTLSKGTGTGNLIGIATDGRHSLTNITAPAWPVSLPASSEQMIIEDNVWGTTHSGSRQIVVSHTHLFTGTLDGSGNATFAHNLSSLLSNNPVWHASESTGGGTLTSITTATQMGGTNIIITGGTASYDYEVTVQVRE